MNLPFRASAYPHRGTEVPHRAYRATMGGRFHSFTVSHLETDLWIGISPGPVTAELRGFAQERARETRSLLDSYARSRPGFLESLDPLPDDPAAPGIVRKMLRAGILARVGPMAAVAGAVAQEVGETLAARFGLREVVVENGGDIWMMYAEPLEVAVSAANSPLSGRIGLRLPPELSPCSVCTSSGTTGASLSFGLADAAMVVAREGAIADAWATAAGNMIGSPEDIEPALAQVFRGDADSDAGGGAGLVGAIIVAGDRMGIRGDLPLRVFR